MIMVSMMKEEEITKLLKFEASELIRKSNEDCRERGFYACRDIDDGQITVAGKCTGTDCSVDLTPCPFTHYPVFMFHTHPCPESKFKSKIYINTFKKQIGGKPELGLHLSPSDIAVFLKRNSTRVSCVSNHHGTACYKKSIPKNDELEALDVALDAPYISSLEEKYTEGLINAPSYEQELNRFLEKVSRYVKPM
jgi:hypothetical protein